MQKHGVILDMSCNKLTFWLGHCQHSKASISKDKLLVSPVKELAPTLKANEPMRRKLLANNTQKYIIPALKAVAPKVAPKAASKAASKAAPKVAASEATSKPLEFKQTMILKVILKASLQPLAKESAKSAKSLELAMVSEGDQLLTKVASTGPVTWQQRCQRGTGQSTQYMVT